MNESRLRHTESSTSGTSPLVPQLERLVHLLQPNHALPRKRAILLLLLTEQLHRDGMIGASGRRAALVCRTAHCAATHHLLAPVWPKQRALSCNCAVRTCAAAAATPPAAAALPRVARDAPAARPVPPRASEPASPPRTAAWSAAARLSAMFVRYTIVFHTATFASLVVPARARVWARHAPCARERPNHYIRHTFMIGNNASKVHLQGESVYKKRALVLAVKDSLI